MSRWIDAEWLMNFFEPYPNDYQTPLGLLRACVDDATSVANNTQACAYFEREILRWEYDIPRMIHSLADGTWKEADRKTENSSEKPNNSKERSSE